MKFFKQLNNKLNLFIIGAVNAQTTFGGGSGASDNADINIGWRIPSLADVISFLIKAFFVIAGLAALLYLLLGAFAWVTSGGDKENVKKAQDKIQASIIGLLILVAVLAIIVTLEQVVFSQKLCLGITCPLTIPRLIGP